MQDVRSSDVTHRNHDEKDVIVIELVHEASVVKADLVRVNREHVEKARSERKEWWCCQLQRGAMLPAHLNSQTGCAAE